MKKEIKKIEENGKFSNFNKRIDSSSSNKMSLHTILYTQNIFVLIFILILFSAIINYFYTIIDTQHLRATKYIEVNELSEDIKSAQKVLALYSKSKVFSRKQELYFECEKAIDEIKQQLPSIYSSYSTSPDLYFAYNGIENGINYIDENLVKLKNYRYYNNNLFYSEYVHLDKVFDYLLDYSSNNYLTALVVENSKLVSIEEQKLTRLRSFLFVIILIVILIYLVVSNKIATTLLKPIEIMVKAADNITHGKLDEKDIKLEGPSEYIFLEKSMNEMKYSLINRMELMRENSELEKVLNDKKIQEIKMKHELEVARFSSLQSQINPHFFFNTLNTLRMLCLLEGAEKSVDLIGNFSSFFRYTLKHTDKVKIEEELDFVEKYLKLQGARFSDRLIYTINIEEDCKNIMIPPLIIQPLVENSIKHGIEKKEEGGLINIKIERENNRILINVEDDGIGIEEDINQILTSGFDTSHIGLRNIQQRLDIFFDNKANLHLKRCSKEGGTKAIISIPFNRRFYV